MTPFEFDKAAAGAKQRHFRYYREIKQHLPEPAVYLGPDIVFYRYSWHLLIPPHLSRYIVCAYHDGRCQ